MVWIKMQSIKWIKFHNHTQNGWIMLMKQNNPKSVKVSKKIIPMFLLLKNQNINEIIDINFSIDNCLKFLNFRRKYICLCLY